MAVVWWMAGMRVILLGLAQLQLGRNSHRRHAAALRLPWYCIVRSAGHGLLAFSGSGSGDPTGGQ